MPVARGHEAGRHHNAVSHDLAVLGYHQLRPVAFHQGFGFYWENEPPEYEPVRRVELASSTYCMNRFLSGLDSGNADTGRGRVVRLVVDTRSHCGGITL